ncbi:MAG: CRTAC1 family protein [Solirubrobacterales bacterium]
MLTRGFPAVALAVATSLLMQGCALSGLRSFQPASTDGIPSDRLFDLGVADFNEDGRLDLFTVNHKFSGAWLENRSGRFVDVTEQIHADPDPEFPGLDELTPPAMKSPGTYVYMSDSPEGEPGLVHIRAVGMEARGVIGFLSSKLRVVRTDDAHVRIGRNEKSDYFVRFRIAPEGALVLDPSSVADAPMAARIDEPADTSQIMVGAEETHPDSRRFRLTLHDRHGIAFADLVGGPDVDAFVAGGGLSGGIAKPVFRGQIDDELLSQDGGVFTDVADATGLNKSGCRGRETEPVDVNADGVPELFESCEERVPMLYRVRDTGGLGTMLAPPAIGTAQRWVQLRAGEPPVLISAGSDGIAVWQRRGPRFERTQLLADSATGEVAQIALGDPDGDGDLDVLAVALTGNTMLRNDDGRLRPVPTRWAGVPAASAAACFVDYDDDGRVDVYAAPQGLIRNLGGGRHLGTGLLRTPPAEWASCNWADFDGDGLRDPLVSYGAGEFARRMVVERRRNVTPIHGHWLEVDLVGPEDNRQAIGASVVVRAGGRPQTQWVGQNDDAPHSQGHYRLYFGLGAAPQVGSLTVRWPNGEKTEVGPRPADQRVEIEQP